MPYHRLLLKYDQCIDADFGLAVFLQAHEIDGEEIIQSFVDIFKNLLGVCIALSTLTCTFALR